MSSGHKNGGGTADPSSADEMDRIEVYLRVKPVAENESKVIEIESDSSIVVNPNTAAQLVGQRQCAPNRNAIRCTFEHVFSAETDQLEVFDRVAKGCVQDVLAGKPAVLFMYGFTGSGKTYTMRGTPQNAGILPRTLDLLFNSLPSNLKVMKCLFKPDSLNGYDVNTEADAVLDYQNSMLASRSSASSSTDGAPVKKKQRNDSREWHQRLKDSSRVPNDIPDYCRVAVFVQYVEIYNDKIYDLLEDAPTEVKDRGKGRSVRILRGDETKYVFGATEVEVSDADEAIDVWLRGENRKRVAGTLLNMESSRSHSVFIVKIVQAPIDQRSGQVVQNKDYVTVTQLNLVDLAGCEQQKKTGTSGDRLKEANNINQSLTVLRKCLLYLRENQLNPNTSKTIPYRECKLTHLFKSYFEGRGRVKMVVCVNPRYEDCVQTLEVLKFSETAQEIEFQKVPPSRINPYVEPALVADVENAPLTALNPGAAPDCNMDSGDDLEAAVDHDFDDDLQKDGSSQDNDEVALAIIMTQLNEAKEWLSTKSTRDEATATMNNFVREWDDEQRKLKSMLSASEKECKRQAKVIRCRDTEIGQLMNEVQTLKEKLIEAESRKELAEKRAQRSEEAYRKAKNEQVRIKKDMESKYAKKKDLLIAKYDQMIREQKSEAMREGRTRGRTDLIMDLLQTDEFKHLDFTSSDHSPVTVKHRSPKRHYPLKEKARSFHTNETPGKLTVSKNIKCISSASEPDLSDAEELNKKLNGHWATSLNELKRGDTRIENIGGCSSPLKGILLQSRKKGVTKLDLKSVESTDKHATVASHKSKFQVVKREVLTSSTGATSFVFREVEPLKEKNTGEICKENHPKDNASLVGSIEIKKRCAVAIEGHPYIKNVVLRDKHGKFV